MPSNYTPDDILTALDGLTDDQKFELMLATLAGLALSTKWVKNTYFSDSPITKDDSNV